MKTKTHTTQILKIMLILAWVAFIGLSIETGAILISYGVSWINPAAVGNLYKGLDLSELREYSFWQYSNVTSFAVALSAMKAYISFLVIKTLSSVNLVNPFKIEVAKLLEKISHILIGTWIVTVLHNGHMEWLSKRSGIQLESVGGAGELVFAAGLVFVIAQVFKRGVEIQSENELTV